MCNDTECPPDFGEDCENCTYGKLMNEIELVD